MSKRNREPQTIAAEDVGQMPDFLQADQAATATLDPAIPPPTPPATEPPPATIEEDPGLAALAWATDILGSWVDEKQGIDADGGQFAVWHTNAPEISLDGSFTPDQLEAMAIWMRANGRK